LSVDGSLLELDPLAAPPLGVEDEPDAEGVLLEPLDELLEEGALDEPPEALPEAESFFVASDEALEDDDGELGVLALPPDMEPDAELEPEGELGVVVEPDDEEVEPGALDFEAARSLSPQPVSRPAPSASETANARAESLILWASVGWGKGMGARNGPVRLRS
jgi:hypothetical protein